jgi:hypothetical protein
VRRRLLPSDQAERDRFLKHLNQKPPPERPPDYGHQSPRLLSEITEGMRSDYEGGSEERTRQTHGLWDATPTERTTPDE